MITRQQASNNIGFPVIYTPFKGCDESQLEIGIITRVTDNYVAVRYGNETTSKSTYYEDLELIDFNTAPKRSKLKNYRHKQDITISKDGSKFIALLGDDLIDGITGFGNTPDEARQDIFLILTDDYNDKISLTCKKNDNRFIGCEIWGRDIYYVSIND